MPAFQFIGNLSWTHLQPAQHKKYILPLSATKTKIKTITSTHTSSIFFCHCQPFFGNKETPVYSSPAHSTRTRPARQADGEKREKRYKRHQQRRNLISPARTTLPLSFLSTTTSCPWTPIAPSFAALSIFSPSPVLILESASFSGAQFLFILSVFAQILPYEQDRRAVENRLPSFRPVLLLHVESSPPGCASTSRSLRSTNLHQNGPLSPLRQGKRFFDESPIGPH